MKSANGRRLVVIGSGIVGVCSALHAQRRGWDVTLFDPRGVAGGASRGNAGVLAVSECLPIGTFSTIRAVPAMLLSRDGPLHIRPQYFPRLAPWLLRMLLASMPSKVERISQALASILGLAVEAHVDLASSAGVGNRIIRSGWIKAYETDASFRAAAGDYEAMRKQGVECQELSRQQIDELEPAIRGRFSRAVFHPQCHHVGNPLTYVQALGSLLASGKAMLRTEDVLGFEVRDGQVDGVRTADGVIPADAIVLAAGAWSRSLAASLGCDIPLDTERGYHMMLDTTACNVKLARPVYWAEKSIVLSPMGDEVRVTSSVEFAGIHAKPDYQLVLQFLEDVQKLLPGAKLRPDSLWLGYRPSIPDSLPVIGAVPGVANAILAFGHGHLGLTLGAVTGRLVGSLLDGDPTAIPLDPFSPARFGGSTRRRPSGTDTRTAAKA